MVPKFLRSRPPADRRCLTSGREPGQKILKVGRQGEKTADGLGFAAWLPDRPPRLNPICEGNQSVTWIRPLQCVRIAVADHRRSVEVAATAPTLPITAPVSRLFAFRSRTHPLGRDRAQSAEGL